MKISKIGCVVAKLLLAVAASADQAAFAALNLQVGIETLNVSSEASINAPPDSQESWDVTLADSYLSFQSIPVTNILDFKARRRILLDNAKKSYVNYSLYDIVGFREMEMKNREMLHELSAGTVNPDGAWLTVDDEHELSLQSRSPAKINEAAQGTDLVFASGNRQLARWSKDGEQVSADDSERFAKFLRYTLGGHPQILGNLAAGRVIPTRLIFTFTTGKITSTRTISVKDVRRVDSTAIDLSSYSSRKADPSEDALDAILDQAAHLMPVGMQAAQKRAGDEIARAFHDGRILDAALGSVELTILIGPHPPLFSQEQVARIRSEPSYQKWEVAARANTKEASAEAVKTYVELRSFAPQKSYLLKIFEANQRANLHDFDASRTLLVEVLQGHPYLAGVYKDLGDVLAQRYDTPRAWRCWDIGRQLAPRFPHFADVTKWENSLLAQHPEYF